jgi:hypothetical protein
MYSSNKDDSVTCQLKDFAIQSSFDFLKNKKVYLFISYEKLAASNGKVKNIKKFVTHTRNMISEYYKTKAMSKSA